MRNSPLLTSLMMSLSVLACSACGANADLSGSAVGEAEEQQNSAQVAFQPEAGGEVVTGKGGKGGGGGGNEEPPPEPPPPDGGTIYYSVTGVTMPPEVHGIDPDGSNDVIIPGLLEENTLLRPSRILHNGERWFLTTRPSSDYSPGSFLEGPSGGRLFEYDLIREGGARVPLTDNASTCIQVWGGGARADWSVDSSGQIDGAISWIGTRWEDVDGDGSCDQVVDGGIFRGALSIDAAGNVSFDQPVAPEIPIALSGNQVPAEDAIWSPDGKRAGYSSDGIWVVDAAGNHGRIFDGRVFFQDWSPDLDPGAAGDQSRIAFTGALTDRFGREQERGTYTIATDGSDLVQVADAKLPKKQSDPTINHKYVYWSPSGSHLSYTRAESPSPVSTDIVNSLHRVAANGADNVVIAESSDGNRPNGIGWSVD